MTNEILLGIDDARRGPVLGPMCLAGCLIRKEAEAEFRKLGVRDSKLLSPLQREKLAKVIKEKALAYSVEMVTPIEIDTGFGEGLNLNKVEALVAAKIINDLSEKLNNKEKEQLKIIIIDCPSTNIPKWKEYVVGYLKNKSLAKIIKCEHKADFHHPVVSAASIIAKTTGDAEIEKLKKRIGVDFGSGYPSDPLTREFLEKNVNNPKLKGIFRESWATWKEARNSKLDEKKTKQEKLFE